MVVSVTVGVAVAVPVGVEVGLKGNVLVGVPVIVAVPVAVAVFVMVAVAVCVALSVGVPEAVAVGEAVGVRVMVVLGVTVGLEVGVPDKVLVALFVGVLVMAGVGVFVEAAGVVGVVLLEGQPAITKVKPAKSGKKPKIRIFICSLSQRIHRIERLSPSVLMRRSLMGRMGPSNVIKAIPHPISLRKAQKSEGVMGKGQKSPAGGGA